MEREAPRTLYTLSTLYQKGVKETDYEVIAVDCGSQPPLSEEMVKQFGPQFRLIRRQSNPSPVLSINYAATQARGKLIMVSIDGARMLSPGIISLTMASFNAFKNPVVATLSMHLGPDIQRRSMMAGYNKHVEDQLLQQSDWKNNGYALFSISALSESSANGWFNPIHESGCLTVRKETFHQLGGYDPKFISNGGGLVNLDYYKRAVACCTESIVLLGESTFHQIHGGVSTNSADPFVVEPFLDEYYKIRKTTFSPPTTLPILIGKIPPEASSVVATSSNKLKTECTEQHEI